MAKRKSASRVSGNSTKSVPRDILQGGRGRARRRRSRDHMVPLLRRLRRVEFALAFLGGKLDLKDFDFDEYCQSVISLEADAKIESRGRNLRGGEVQVPHEGGTVRQAARATKDFRRPTGRNESEASPFSPGPPYEDEP